MNIKKTTTNRPLLTVDDPSIYQEHSDDFVQAVIATATNFLGSPNTLYLIGNDLLCYVPYVYVNDKWIKLPNPFSHGPFIPYPQLRGSGIGMMHQLNQNLVAIDNHLYALRKELSYWNLYKISYSVEVADNFCAILSLLAPGEALIINLDGLFQYQGQEYKRGDIVARLTDGNYVTIESSTAGFYYPSSIIRNPDTKMYSLAYSYEQNKEPTELKAELTSVPLSKPAQVETFEIEGGEASQSFIYGIREDMQDSYDFDFDIASAGSATLIIPPIVKFFTEDGEEIALDFTCMVPTASSQYHLNISSDTGKPSTLKYVYIK